MTEHDNKIEITCNNDRDKAIEAAAREIFNSTRGFDIMAPDHDIGSRCQGIASMKRAIEVYEAAMAEEIPVTCNNDRGIQDYGAPVKCLYGSEVTVRDSSSAEHIACWLRIDDSSWSSRMDSEGRRLGPKTKDDYSSAHLDLERAEAIVARLQLWIDCVKKDATPFGGLVD